MLTGTKPTLRSHPSLLALQSALRAAESVSPARPPRMDANERLALQLIARMQADYKKSLPFSVLQGIPGPYALLEHSPEIAGVHA